MPRNQNPFLDWVMNEQINKEEKIRSFRRYYDGDHPTFLTDRQWEYLNLDRDKPFAMNVCAIIVDTPTERMAITGFTAQDEEEKEEPGGAGEVLEGEEEELSRADQIEKVLSDWWQQNNMDANQAHVHRSAMRDMESFVIVEWDSANERPKISYDFAYDGTSGVRVHYRPGKHNEVWFASKRWNISEGPNTGKAAHLNLYFPDRIEKWISQEGQGEEFWQPVAIDDDPAKGQQIMNVVTESGAQYIATGAWWTDTDEAGGEPLGVPIFPFVNKDNGAGMGMSELDNAIPIQDMINKTYIDLIASADLAGFSMLWYQGKIPDAGWRKYPGADLPIDPAVDGEAAQVGQIDPGDMSQLIKIQEWQISMLSGITSTPQSRFIPAGGRPGEGTRKEEEAPLVAKVIGKQMQWGNVWEDVMGMALKLGEQFGKMSGVSDLILKAAWKDAQVRNEKMHTEAIAVKKDKLEISRQQAWRELEYDKDTIEKMESEKEADRLNRIEDQTMVNQGREAETMAAAGRVSAMRQAGASGEAIPNVGPTPAPFKI